MTKIYLLKALKLFTELETKDLLLPVRRQKNDAEEPPPRAAAVYMMRLVKSSDAQKAAPYIIHQAITGKDSQPESGQQPRSKTAVRSIFCVYCEDEQEGSLMLLNLMERTRIALLKAVTLDGRYQLDMQDGLEHIIYPDDSWPYYAGEMASTWTMPSVHMEVDEYVN